MEYSEESYDKLLQDLFVRFPSFQNAGRSAYKPGLEHMVMFDGILGHPHRRYRTIHIAGTNGKGSVSNMFASVLSASGLKTGLYTSPHLIDFRERMRISDGNSLEYIEKEEVFDFIVRWKEVFEHLDLSFFEITTMMAFDWFARRNVDIAVIETGLGGRLDSTNIISPVLEIITNIGLDHCDLLGSTLPEIAFEKAGIIKPHTPVVIGESSPETDDVFERKVLYTNLPEQEFMGDRKKIMSLLTFADKTVPALWEDRERILREMDLQGNYQEKNLRTVLTAVGILRENMPPCTDTTVEDAIIHTAERMEFHGRWEKLSESPLIIADIGHNAHGLKYNFAELERLKAEGKCSSLLIVYGMVADKDSDAVVRLMPDDAEYFFTAASSRRALPANRLAEKFRESKGGNCMAFNSVKDAVSAAVERAGSQALPLIYIGGSAYVVAEAMAALKLGGLLNRSGGH